MSISVTPPPNKGLRLTPVQWLICFVACIGFAFDLYETLMLPLIVRPALMDIAHLKPGSVTSIAGSGYYFLFQVQLAGFLAF